MTEIGPPYIELQEVQIEALKAELVNLRAALWQAENELRRVSAENARLRAERQKG